MHAKAMLLINHGKCEVLKDHIILKQGVCANRYLNVTIGKAFK
ncbi:hypothetical protein CKA32_007132 [Geitlerinema sp. FC II]|nr:hypothetical protein CKA32_007132 [Geitlerinema sp. FC II]